MLNSHSDQEWPFLPVNHLTGLVMKIKGKGSDVICSKMLKNFLESNTFEENVFRNKIKPANASQKFL